jgi:hypothetical protein
MKVFLLELLFFLTSSSFSVVLGSHGEKKSHADRLTGGIKLLPEYGMANWVPRIKHNASNDFLNRAPNASFVPVKHPLDDFISKSIRESVLRLGHLTRLVFVGDGVLHKLKRNETIWNEWETKYAAMMFAFPGDKTENILQRLYANRVIAQNVTTSPLVVLMAGMSNIALGDNLNSIVIALNNIIKLIQQKFQRSPILLCSLLPRKIKGFNMTVNSINELLQERSFNEANMSYADVGKPFRHHSSDVVDGSNPFLVQDMFPNDLGFEAIHSVLNPIFEKKLEVLNRPLPPKHHSMYKHLFTGKQFENQAILKQKYFSKLN